MKLGLLAKNLHEFPEWYLNRQRINNFSIPSNVKASDFQCDLSLWPETKDEKENWRASLSYRYSPPGDHKTGLDLYYRQVGISKYVGKEGLPTWEDLEQIYINFIADCLDQYPSPIKSS